MLITTMIDFMETTQPIFAAVLLVRVMAEDTPATGELLRLSTTGRHSLTTYSLCYYSYQKLQISLLRSQDSLEEIGIEE